MSHASKSLALNDRDELFVNVGAPSNACQTKTRSPGSPGLDPCPQLERQAAIWKFSASRPGQRQLDGERYVTGTRNIVGMAWNDAQSALYFVMHGRDQLSSLWAEHFDDSVSAEVPAEEFHLARPGADFGWPYTYVDPRTGKRLIAPEYRRRRCPGGRARQVPERHCTPIPPTGHPTICCSTAALRFPLRTAAAPSSPGTVPGTEHRDPRTVIA